MPQTSSIIQAVRDQIHSDIRSAAGSASMPCSKGFPRKEESALPRATVVILNAAESLGGEGAARDVQLSMEWGIRIYLPMPADEEDSGEDACLLVKDAFAALVEASPRYAGHGHYPHISRWTPDAVEIESVEECTILDMVLAMDIYASWGT